MSNNNSEMVLAPYTVLLTVPDQNGDRHAVREDDPKGVTLLVAKGSYISKEEIQRYRLFGDPELNMSMDQIAEYETKALSNESENEDGPKAAEDGAESSKDVANGPPLSGVEPPPPPPAEPKEPDVTDEDELGD